MNCYEVMDWIDDLTRENLENFRSNHEIMNHIEECPDCEKYLQGMILTLQAEQVDEYIDFWPDFNEAIESKSRRTGFHFRFGWATGIAGAVAAMVLFFGLIFTPAEQVVQEENYSSDLLYSYMELAVDDSYMMDEEADALDYYYALAFNY